AVHLGHAGRSAQVLNLNVMGASASDKVPTTEGGSDGFRVDRRTHQQKGSPAMRKPGAQPVGIDAPLVKLIEDHMVEAFEPRGILEHDSRCRIHDPGRVGSSVVVTNLVANLRSQRNPSERCHSPRQRLTSEATWLDDGNAPL